MTPFEHLSVLISIVIGLSIAHLLSSLHKVIQAGDRVRWYWLSAIWTAVMFVAQVEWWWASFDYREQTDWSFFFFLFILLSPVTLYLAAAFVLPDIEQGMTYDMKQYYYETRGWFFGVVAAGPALDWIRRGVQADSFLDFGSVSNGISAVLVASLCFSRNERHHAVITLAVASLFLFFIVSEALHLG
jgi:hypothetical protein